jgi:hypothetical protein
MTLEPHHFLHLKCDRLTSSEEGASSAFTRVFDALLAPVSKDGGGPMLRDAAP